MQKIQRLWKKYKGNPAMAVPTDKWIRIIAAVMAVLTVLYVLHKGFPAAHAAADYETVRNKVTNFMAGFGTTNFTHMKDAYRSMRSFTSATVSGPYKNLSKYISAAAGLLVAVYAISNIIRESSKGEIAIDYWYRLFATVAIAIVVVTGVGTVMDSLYGLGDNIVGSVAYYMEQDTITVGGHSGLSGAGGTTSLDDEEKKKKFISALSTLPGLNGDENGVGSLEELMEAGEGDVNFWALQAVDEMLTPLQFISYAPLVICMFLIYSAIFELKIRQLFAPLAVASIAYEGGRSMGMRFLKKYLACFVKIAIYFFIAAIGSQMTQFFFLEVVGGTAAQDSPKAMISILMMLLSNVIAAMAMMQSAGLGDEIIGV